MANIATITNNIISALSGTTSQVLLGDATLTDFKLDSLTDVNVPTPGDGDVLRWNSTTSLWEASDAAGITGSGTTNYIAKFTPNGGTLGNSQIFDNGTNVGINTASPTSKLTINGSFLATTSGVGLEYNSGILYHGGSYYQFPSGSYYLLYGRTGMGLIFGSNNAEVGRFDLSGNLGIGTTTPSYKLHVNGFANATGYLNSGTTFEKAIYIGNIAAGATFALGRLNFADVYTHHFRVRISSYYGVKTFDFFGYQTTMFKTVSGVSNGGDVVVEAVLDGSSQYTGVKIGVTTVPADYVYTATIECLSRFSSWEDYASNTVLTPTTIGFVNTFMNLGGGNLSINSNVYNVKFSVNSGISSSTANVISIQQNTNGAVKDAAALGIAVHNNGEATNEASMLFTTATNGSLTEKMRLTNTGFLGIGTTSPTERLVVQGNGAKMRIETGTAPTVYYTQMESNYDAANTFNIIDGGGHKFGSKALVTYNDTYINSFYNVYIATGTVTNNNINNIRLYVTQTGNVGIGTTTPEAQLQVGAELGTGLNVYSFSGYKFGVENGSSRFIGPEITASNQTVVIADFMVGASAAWNTPTGLLTFSSRDRGNNVNGGVLGYIGIAKSTSVNSVGSGNLIFGTAAADASTSTERMRITTAGFVGIGTTAPQTALDVAGSIRVSGTGGTGFFTGSNVILETPIAWANIGGSAFQIRNTTSLGLVFGAATSQLMTLTTGGSLGIGITAPVRKLQINEASANTVALAITNSSTTVNGFQLIVDGSGGAALWNYSNTNLSFGTNNNDRMMITNTGNVGIGTTTPAYKFEVQTSGISTPLRLLQTNYQSLTVDYPALYTTQINFAVFGRIEYDGNGGVMTISNRSTQALSSSMGFVMGTTERMRITDTGNVGIGTASPSAQLTLNNATEARFRMNVNGVNQLIFNHDGSTGVIRTESATPLTFGSFGSERMRITDSGEVLIGTTADAGDFKLQVVGSTYLSSNLSVGTTYNGFAANIGGTVYAIGGHFWIQDGYGFANAISPSTGMFPDSTHNISFKNNNTTSVYINSLGDVGIGTTAPSNFSGGGLTLGSTTTGKNLMIFSSSAGNNGLIQFLDTAGSSALQISATTTQATLYGYGARLMNFFTNGIERIRITHTGNVGIGTSSPLAKLSVLGSTNLGNSNGNTLLSTHTTTLSGYANIYDAVSRYGDYGVLILNADTGWTGASRRFMITNALDNTKFAIIRSVNADTSPSLGTAGAVSSGTVDFVIDNLGNIGIGATNPTVKLDVVGAANITSTLTARSGFTTYVTDGLFGATAAPSKIILPNSGNEIRFGYATSGDGVYHGRIGILSFNTDIVSFGAAGPSIFTINTGASNTERFRINAVGNVGVGTTDPAYLLDINGSSRVNGTHRIINSGSLRLTKFGIDSTSFGDIAFVDSLLISSINGSIKLGAGNPSTFTEYFGIANGGAATFNNTVTISSGLTVNSGNITLTSLSGSGNRLVVASSTGVLSTQSTDTFLTSLTGEATSSGGGATTVTLTNSAVIGKVLTGLNINYAAITASDSILSAFGKIQGQIDGLQGGTIYKGSWNASTNTPTITSGTGTQGNYYVVTTAGTTTIDGVSSWAVGDWIIFNGTVWEKIPNVDAITSVNGQTGVVSLTTSNINEGTNFYYTDARARAAISLTTSGASGAASYSGGTLNIPNYTLTGLGGVASTRTITINGTALDLSSDRTYNVGTVTSIVAGSYLTGGTITGSGTIAVDATTTNTADKIVARDASGNFSAGTITATLTGTASNATTAGGLSVHANRNNEVNKIVRTDGSGYIQAGWINTTSGDNGTTAIDRIYASSDAYIRYYTPANFRTVLDVPTRTGGSASGTWGINVTGNAATATISSQVTINYSNNSDASYQMLWGSGNSVYGTAGITCNPFTDAINLTGTLYAGGLTINGFGRMYGGDFWHSGTANNGTRTPTIKLGRFSDQELPSYTIYADDTNGDILEFYSERFTGDFRLTRNSETGLRNMMRVNSDNGVSTLDLYDGGGSSISTRINTNGNSYILGGNVGIGTNNPIFKFEVSGTTLLGHTLSSISDASASSRSTMTFTPSSTATNANSYGFSSTVTYVLGTAQYNGNEAYNAAALFGQAVIVGSTTQSTQPIRAVMAGLVGRASSAVINISDYRMFDVKTPDDAGLSGHSIGSIYGLKIGTLKGAAGYNITNGWGVYQEGVSDNNYFRGKVLIGTTSVGGSPLRLSGLPTSSAGLSAGDVWNSGGTLRIV